MISETLNSTSVNFPRVSASGDYRIHVSDALETEGPRAFCAREHVLAAHSPRTRVRGKITPARELLFGTGHFIHDFVLQKIIQRSPHAPNIFAHWSCKEWTYNSTDHERFTGKLVNARHARCKCGLPLDVHHELDLELPKLLLVGHPDIVFLHNDRFYIHELKTWDRKDLPFDDISVPIASHRLQVSFYYKMLQAMVPQLAPGATVSRNIVVDYIDRGNSKLFGGNPYKSLRMRPEPDEHLDKFKNRLEHVVVGMRTGKLPKRICPDINCTRARNCDLAVECFGRRGNYVENQVDNRGGQRLAEYSGVRPRQRGEGSLSEQLQDEDGATGPRQHRPSDRTILRLPRPIPRKA